jgi:hypothetical protein
MKTPKLVVMVLSLFALSVLATGCGRTISKKESTTVSNDGTVKTKETTVTEKPDGTIVKEETKKTTKP